MIGALILGLASIFAFVSVTGDLKAKGPQGETILISVEEGDLLSDVSSSLNAQNLIGNPFIFETYAKLSKLTDFKVGIYKIDRGWDAHAILAYMTDATNAEKNDVALTIIPGDWAKDVAASIAEVTDYTAEEILAQWNDKTYVALLDADYNVLTSDYDKPGVKVLLEGYLMP